MRVFAFTNESAISVIEKMIRFPWLSTYLLSAKDRKFQRNLNFFEATCELKYLRIFVLVQ